MAQPVIVLFAPTASGKTALALEIFGKSSPSFFKGMGELISADSMQVYRGLDIGTAKPSVQERAELPHHLIDVREPDEQFSVSDFVSSCDALCLQIASRGKIPVIAGGTGFYIRNFILGLPDTPESDPAVRGLLQKRLSEEGGAALYAELCRIDPASAKKINENDDYRILRALEIFYTSGRTKSSFELSATVRSQYDFCVIVLSRERDELYERINRRVDEMFASGLEREVRALIETRALTSDLPGMQAIGYREWFRHDYSVPEGIERIRYEIKRDSRKYAKKQYTFMRGIPGAHIIELSGEDSGREQVLSLLNDFMLKKSLPALDLNCDLDNN